MNLIIPKAIEEKIHAYVMSVESEIAGMGQVHVNEAGDIVVDDVMIYQQEVTGGTADLSPQAIARWQSALVKAGGSPKNWRLWWHSHANMAAFFSKRDTDTIDGSTEADWMCSLVVNKRRERQARLDTYRPFRMYMDNLDIEVEGASVYEVPEAIKAEVREKVKSPPVKTATGMGYGAPTTASGVRTIDDVIGLHRYCPMQATNGKDRTCYMPYGEDEVAAYSDCTHKAFTKAYGKLPLSPNKLALKGEQPESVAEIMAICKEIEAQVRTMKDYGQGDSAVCVDLQQELADWYFNLADAMPSKDEELAEAVRKTARELEDLVSAFVPYAAG